MISSKNLCQPPVYLICIKHPHCNSATISEVVYNMFDWLAAVRGSENHLNFASARNNKVCCFVLKTIQGVSFVARI